MTTSFADRYIRVLRRQWRKLTAAVVVPTRRRASPLERYLGQAVDFADLEHRIQVANELEQRPLW